MRGTLVALGSRQGARQAARRSPTRISASNSSGAVYERVLDLEPGRTTHGRRDSTPRSCANRPARSTRHSRWRSSSCDARSRRSWQARRPTGSCRCASSIRPWAAARFSWPRAAISPARTSARWSTRDGWRRAMSMRSVARNAASRRRAMSGRSRREPCCRPARAPLVVADDAGARAPADVSRSPAAIRQQPHRRDARRPRPHPGSRPPRDREPLPLFDGRRARAVDARHRAPSCANSPRDPDDTVADVRAKEAAVAAAHRRVVAARPLAARRGCLVRALVSGRRNEHRRRRRSCAR